MLAPTKAKRAATRLRKLGVTVGSFLPVYSSVTHDQFDAEFVKQTKRDMLAIADFLDSE